MGREGEAELAPYCASKFAIEGITKSMALELPHGMAVVALDPGGSISTPMLKSCAPQYINESPTPETWSHKAIEYILNITIDKNGDSLTCLMHIKSTFKVVLVAHYIIHKITSKNKIKD